MKVCAGLITLFFSLASSTNVDPLFQYLCNAKENVDCTSKIFGDHKTGSQSCIVEFYPKNSEECSCMNFSKSTEKRFDLGNVHLKPYVWKYDGHNNYNYTVFNVTFTDIKWNHLKFRFEILNDTKTKEFKNHCREIIISGSIPDEYKVPFLNYDCLWSHQYEKYENFSFIFEYEVINSENYNYEKLIFKVPPVSLINGQNAIPFFYLNLTDPTKLNLHAIPQAANPSLTKFFIEKCVEKTNNSSVKCEAKEEVSIDKDFVYSLTPCSTGWHYFKITPSSESCPNKNCPTIVSSKIYYEIFNVIYTILWNALWILLISGLCFSLYWMIKRHQKFTPKILLIHPDADKVHTDIIYKLSKYFEIEYGWMVVWNEEIELTQHGDPYIWCLEAFMNSNTVLYIDKATDTISSNDVIPGNIHMHLHDIFFKILKTSKRKKEMKFFNIMLDSHDPGAILPELKEFNTFYLPSEWESFIRSVKRHSWVQNILIKLPALSNSTCGKELLKAFNQS